MMKEFNKYYYLKNQSDERTSLMINVAYQYERIQLSTGIMIEPSRQWIPEKDKPWKGKIKPSFHTTLEKFNKIDTEINNHINSFIKDTDNQKLMIRKKEFTEKLPRAKESPFEKKLHIKLVSYITNKNFTNPFIIVFSMDFIIIIS